MFPYPERPPHESGFCSMRLVWLLSDLGIPRRHVLLMTEQEATATLAHVVKNRVIDAAIRKAAHYA